MQDAFVYPRGRRAKRIVREFGLGPEKVAKITVLGVGPWGAKSRNVLEKSNMLEGQGLIFPRRNLVIRSNVLEEGIIASGARQGWKSEELRHGGLSMTAFGAWCNETAWPLVETIFEGKPLYIRSDSHEDALGRGAYESIPFPNAYGKYTEPQMRAVVFSRELFRVVGSYFSDTAKAFRKTCGSVQQGMNVFISQFIGMPSTEHGVIIPFMSAVVKSTLFEGKPGNGLVRFEYGMGKGALSGRSIIIENGAAVETIVGKTRKEGLYCSYEGTNAMAMDLAAAEEKKFDETKWGLLNSILAGAYPLSGRSVEENGRELLGWLIRSVPKIEKENGGPVYLELVSSSFMNRLRWFAVQVADFPLMHSIPAPPKDAQFVSNSDFCGHGEVKGRKEIFVFSRKAFGALGSKKSADTMLELARINAEKRDFVVVLPQEALTGTNLSDLKQASGKYFSNACAVLEYQMLGGSEWAGSLHQELSCEHFEQLARDFKLLFIPVEKLSLGGFEAKLGDEHAMPMAGDVHLACDRERRVAWGSLRNLE